MRRPVRGRTGRGGDRGRRITGNSANVTLRDNTVLFPNGVGIEAGGTELNRVEGNTIIGPNYYGLKSYAPRSTITRNTIRKVGVVPRLGKDGLGGGCCAARGIDFGGEASTVSYNRLDSIGYNGIGFGGINQTIERNVIKYLCLTTFDGSGIYTWNDSYDAPGAAGTVIRENIVIGGVAHNTPNPVPDWWSNGIYLDDRTHDITVTGNTVAFTYLGIYLHNTKRHVVRGNNVFRTTDHAILFSEDQKSKCIFYLIP